MPTLYYSPGACSLAAHIVLEEGGQPYEARIVNLAQGEQRSEAYLKIHPLGRVPALVLDNGTAVSENTSILPYLGKRFGLWPKDEAGELKAHSIIGMFAAAVHPAYAHIARPGRYATDTSTHPNIQATGKAAFADYLKQIDGMLAGREWLGDSYSVLDPYAFVFYSWGVRRELPMAELKNYTALRNRLLARPAVQRVVESEKIVA